MINSDPQCCLSIVRASKTNASHTSALHAQYPSRPFVHMAVFAFEWVNLGHKLVKIGADSESIFLFYGISANFGASRAVIY